MWTYRQIQVIQSTLKSYFIHCIIALNSVCKTRVLSAFLYSLSWTSADLVSSPWRTPCLSVSPSPLQPRLLQKPHRFLRDPLLRPDPTRHGGLDHAVHNRIWPDVWLRLPAGVEEEEEWSPTPPQPSFIPFLCLAPPLPGVHIGAMLFSGALAFFLLFFFVFFSFWTICHHTDQKTWKKKISQD